MLPAGPTDHTASALLQARQTSASIGRLPAVQRFADTLPGRVLASDDFERFGSWRMPRSRALHAREIAPDPEGSLTALRFDIDAADAATHWLDAELPPPNLVVRNPDNGHCHYTYFLARWVRLENERAVRYAGAVRDAMTTALQRVKCGKEGVDLDYAGKYQHNPLHRAYSVTSPRAEPYDLAELAQYLDLQGPQARPSEVSSCGRNCETFDRVRQWAYNVVGGFKREGSFPEFAEVVRRRVEATNAAFPTPLPVCEVRSISKSIAGWTWNVYRSRDPKARERRQAAWRSREEQRRLKRAAEGRSREVLLERMLERHRLVADLTREGRSVAETMAATGLSRRHVQRLRALSAGKPRALPSAARGIDAEGRNGGAAAGSVPQGREPGPEGTRPDPSSSPINQGAPSIPTASELAREAPIQAKDSSTAEGAVVFAFATSIRPSVPAERQLRPPRNRSAFGCSAARSP